MRVSRYCMWSSGLIPLVVIEQGNWRSLQMYRLCHGAGDSNLLISYMPTGPEVRLVAFEHRFWASTPRGLGRP